MSLTSTTINTANAIPNSASERLRDNRFYLAMSIACAAAVFIGFSRTYYLKEYFGTPALPVLFHVHGAVMTCWMLFFVLQTALIANGRVAVHRTLGYLGAALVVVMVPLDTAAAFAAARLGRIGFPFAVDPEASCLFALEDLAMFGAFVWAGFHFRRQRETHQRLMLLAVTCALLPPGLGRWLSRVNPLLVLPAILAFILAGPIYDLITRRRIHTAYRWGLLAFFFTLPPFRILLAKIRPLHDFIGWVIH
jgi:hypothetical protein